MQDRSSARRPRRRHVAVGISIVALAAGGTGAGVALAGGGGSGQQPGASTTAAKHATSAPSAATDVVAGAIAALDDLAAQGVLTQAQADAVATDVRAGSVDPRALIQDNVLDASQAQAVASAIDRVKRAAAG